MYLSDKSPLGLRVLYVDDEPINRNLFERMVQRMGCTADVLSDGDEVSKGSCC